MKEISSRKFKYIIGFFAVLIAVAITLFVVNSGGSGNAEQISELQNAGINAEIISRSKEENTEPVADPDAEKSKLLDPPFVGTLEELDNGWSKDDVLTAWNMTDASGVYNEYTDRLFCDINNDLSKELILTSYSTKRMYFFTRKSGKAELFSDYIDFDIANGYIIEPPTDEEIIRECEVYDYQDIHSFKLHNINGEIYVSGISWRSDIGKTCWIKKSDISRGEFVLRDVFRWGMFTDNTSLVAPEFEYRKYDDAGQYSYATQQEIDNFLLLMK